MPSQSEEPISQPPTTRPQQSSNTRLAQGGEREGNVRADRPILHNRIPAVMVHVSRYAFEGQARLAADIGVSRSTVIRKARSGAVSNRQRSPTLASRTPRSA